ncbi:MAG TPA: hypothetical protein HA367_08360 [Candidatus Methanofastidiosum sp.]|nr:hypothetical protein [Methanofastidiosum sp.]
MEIVINIKDVYGAQVSIREEQICSLKIDCPKHQPSSALLSYDNSSGALATLEISMQDASKLAKFFQ